MYANDQELSENIHEKAMYVNEVKGERFPAIKATANGDCLFNSSSILLHGNESLAL